MKNLRICLRQKWGWVLALATFALWLGTAPSVGAQCTHRLLYTFYGEAANDYLGYSVSGAGDVDGDGYDDLIVGAPYNNEAGTNAGRAYVYSGQTGLLICTFTGEAEDDQFGSSVSGADLNGDGLAELIVGAPLNDDGGTDAGQVYVYVYDDDDDTWNNLYTVPLTGEDEGDCFGSSVSGAGYVDNDVYPDFIVGAPFNDEGGDGAGRAYVYSGETGNLIFPPHTFTGEAAGDRFGYSVSGVGDVNDDEHDDFIVGAHGNDAGGSEAGQVYFYSGQTGNLLFPPQTFTGEAEGDIFGRSVSGAGYVDGDLYPDFIVGAPFNDEGGDGAGRAYVYAYDGNTWKNLYTFTGEAAIDNFGISVSGAGDVDNDGFDDLIVGAYRNNAGGLWAGRAYVYSGKTGKNLYTFSGEAEFNWFGYSVSGAGDVDSDGYADLIVGALAAGVSSAGRAYVFSCQELCSYEQLYTFDGEAVGDSFGWSVSGAGDVDDDGYDDLIVGAWFSDALAGRAYVYSGQSGLSLHTFTGEAAGDWFGCSVSGAGYVNEDEYADVIVGALGNNAGGVYAGRAYVYAYDGNAWKNLHTFTGEAGGDWFGVSVSGAGDVNNDGFDDLIVGAPFNDEVGTDAGQAYVYSGWDGNELQTFLGEAAGDWFGRSVSGAGYVDDEDEFADLIVGARYNDPGGDWAGRAYVYSGMTWDNPYTFTGEAANDYFRYSVSGAGDVNKDGYADLIVGAPLNDVVGTNAGQAYVYSGETGDLFYTFDGEAAEDWFGYSVSGAGDVDGDGYADLIVGARYNDAGGTRAGRAYVYSGQTKALLYTFTGEAAGDEFGVSVSGAGDVNNDGLADLIVGAHGHDAGGSGAGRAYVYACPPPYDCGNVNADGEVNLSDIVWFINYLLQDGDPPQCPIPYTSCADATGDGEVGLPDVVYLINYVLKSGPDPIC